MDTSTAHPAPDRPEVRISDPGEVAAALPHLLGFHPQESVVLIGLGGPSGGRVGLTVRADLPAAHDAAAAAAVLTRSLRTDRPDAALVVVVSEEPDVLEPWEEEPLAGAALPHRSVVHALVGTLAAAGVAVRDVLLVRGGRWWSYDCPYPCCLPGAGTPVPGGVSPLAAAAVSTGQVLAPDRAALAARLDPPPGAREGVRAACSRVASRRAARARGSGWAALLEESWTAVLAAVARCGPGAPSPAGPLTDEETAMVLWALRDARVRDRALALALGDDAAAAETLWTECTRRGSPPLDAAPATLLAVSVWLRGDGAMANVALGRALDSDPGHVLARLLRQGLDACLTPGDLRELVEQAVGRG
ncbi:DUF4192 domain-containing protein [Blastococcus sp. TF02A-35]|uniref:DUF4192 domain-containing protein n=1 Tax=Blastococcus sp. TF02A-35 TaxID=2559612 RepID=UPI001073F732|nr:DUF4192 domain-containing protein [Blastococcus sp. TF02A_35]TFV53211.1 DUF4192 domain-containing protein [Blastococcus sp. TF02A_35]